MNQPLQASPTASSHWKQSGEPDPHGARYDCERADLAMGELTDDELANGAFMCYDRVPPLQDVIAGRAHMPIAWMTAVKDRIRWLSRSLDRALQAQSQTDQQADPFAFADQPWPRTRDVGRLDDMNIDGHLRVGLDSDNDVYVSVWNKNTGASVEFCNGGGGGGRSPKTRAALIALMIAMEEDNLASPDKDWWARRMGGSSKKESP